MTLSQNSKNKKNISNDKMLLEFKLTKLDSEISLSKDEQEKQCVYMPLFYMRGGINYKF